MPNSLATLTDGIVDIGNAAIAVTTRHRHSRNLSDGSGLTVPGPPQHTNVATHHAHDTSSSRLTANTSSHTHSSSTLSSSTSSTDNRRNSQAGLSAEDGSENNMTIEFEGGTHVIIRPNRIIRGMYSVPSRQETQFLMLIVYR